MRWWTLKDQVGRTIYWPEDGKGKIQKRGRRYFLLLEETRLVPQGIFDTEEEAKEAYENR